MGLPKQLHGSPMNFITEDKLLFQPFLNYQFKCRNDKIRHIPEALGLSSTCVIVDRPRAFHPGAEGVSIMRWKPFIIASVLILASTTVAAQEIPWTCVHNCNTPAQPAARPAARPAAPSAPSPAQIAQQQRQQAAYQNALGNDCYTKGDWDCAIRYYQTALQYLPNDAVIQENLIRAQAAAQSARDAAAQKAAEAERQQRDAAAAEEIRQSMNRLTTTLNQDRASSGLEVGGTAAPSPSLNFMPAAPGVPDIRETAESCGGRRCNLKPKAAVSADEPLTFMRDAPKSGSPSHRALDEANSTLYATDHKDVWDTEGKATPSTIHLGAVTANLGASPAVRALMAHIPKCAPNEQQCALNNPVIKTSIAWYASQEKDKAVKQAQIKEIQRQIDSHTGDTAILNVKKEQLTNDVKQINTNQQKAQETIKLNLGAQWIESPPAASGSQPAAGGSQRQAAAGSQKPAASSSKRTTGPEKTQ